MKIPFLKKKELDIEDIINNPQEYIDPQTEFGKPVPDEVLIEAEKFQAPEGIIQLIYGRIRQGKSTEAVRRMYESLSNGRVVYSNIDLDLSTTRFDDRLMFSMSLKNLIFGKKRYYEFLPQNFYCFNPTTGVVKNGVGTTFQAFNPEKAGDEIRWLNNLTDCEIYYDEGQWLLDSYEKTFVSIPKRKLITESGHCNRTIVIIAQRTQSVHVNARGNVNQFFRCQKIKRFFFFTVLQVEEFQDMKGTDVDESEPVSIVKHYSSNKYWNLFNTHYLRAGRPKSQDVHYMAYDLTILDRFIVFILNIFQIAGLSRFLRLKPKESREARENFGESNSVPEVLSVQGSVSQDTKSLGVESDSATIKNGERLNTIPVGANGFQNTLMVRSNARAQARHEYFRKKEIEKKRKELEKDQLDIPF